MAPRRPQEGELRDGFKFRSGRLSLDLPASLAARLKAEPKDLLETPQDLGRWLVAAGLAPKDPKPTAEELRQARELREALYRLAVARLRDEDLDFRDRALVNRWAAEPPPAPQLGPEGLTWTSGGVRSLLAAVARDGVELLGGPLAERIRNCEGEGCALLFVDTSRSGQRRWCSMSGCGNKAKVEEFRRRQRGEGG
ncbi:CGNR zinc finger domain-containing protein [Pyxidicoccus xibeiensis]|uniref:CGNR zinc finger domain-containing protein n=1 Tax=Pyxidicoccus xibeiensis TaxID=2906759 RepID=UPI0020A7CAE8|nr:ABATE domain-containing protein [Pyxidicoccus xibeiensis]MCP3135945.1 ABATE domain-containing protein [Pyxidicoccus xibeiensis]